VPREKQALAQESRQQIKIYASQTAQADLQRVWDAARDNGDVPDDMVFLTDIAKKIYKDIKMDIPETWNAKAVLKAFPSYIEALGAVETKYRDEIFGYKDLQKNAVKLGLDLSGGLSIVLQVGSTLTNDTPADAMARALEVLNNRIDQFGLTEPVIRTQGSDQIYIEIPGTADPERINDIIMGKGSLAFHLEDSDATEKFYDYYRINPFMTINPNGVYPDIFPDGEVLVLGYYIKDQYGLDEQARNSDGYLRFIAVKKEVGLDGNYIINASVSRDNRDGKPQVTFRLNDEGGDIFYQLTTANINKNLTIVLDGKIKSSARISSSIRDSGQITGFGADEAHNIALVLRTGALPVELEVVNQQSIGASMGEDTINQGLYALLGGIVAVLIFMIFYYRTAGINAIIAQLLNFYIMFSILSALNFTLTLPAIAGFILTIGMAVDANVIIFERMKDEMRLGKSRKAVVEAGFSKAFWAIMDSNITTFIAAMFLSQLGSGPIRGFAVSLSIGVFSSVFTSLFVSRLIFDFGTDVFHSKKLSVSWRTRIQHDTVRGVN
jgi:preprotein translocase subunit SecD